MASQTFNVLLIDDDADDLELTRQMLRQSRIPLQIRSSRNGEKALAFLRGANGDRPDLILLDLNMPVMDGREFLRAVKSDLALKTIPVVILTTSNAAEEIVSSYGLGASGYVNKPLGIDQFAQVEQIVEDFWIQREKLWRDGF